MIAQAQNKPESHYEAKTIQLDNIINLKAKQAAIGKRPSKTKKELDDWIRKNDSSKHTE